jgi:hypothetical protein
MKRTSVTVRIDPAAAAVLAGLPEVLNAGDHSSRAWWAQVAIEQALYCIADELETRGLETRAGFVVPPRFQIEVGAALVRRGLEREAIERVLDKAAADAQDLP